MGRCVNRKGKATAWTLRAALLLALAFCAPLAMAAHGASHDIEDHDAHSAPHCVVCHLSHETDSAEPPEAMTLYVRNVAPLVAALRAETPFQKRERLRPDPTGPPQGRRG